MLSRLLRRIKRFFYKSRTINDEPINKVSLTVIILIDIFILVNVFIGLDDIGRWYISPSQAYGCYPTWQSYQTGDASPRKDYDVLRQAIEAAQNAPVPLTETYQSWSNEHLGSVADSCQDYAQRQTAVNTAANRDRLSQIDALQQTISRLEQANATIRQQYDSTLLEDIAGQPRDQSINAVGAAEARDTLEANNAEINTLKAQQQDLRDAIVGSPEGDRYLSLLRDEAQFQRLTPQRDRAQFWYPTVQLLFQGLFLVPLLALSLGLHRYAQARQYGLVALMSWHLVIIFCVPLMVKGFQLFRFGGLFQALYRLVATLLGGLLFLVSYLYILAIPLVGFGIIKFFQRIVFNPRVQAAGRVQKGRCIRCAKKLQRGDTHCPHCGYHQFTDCRACHQPTYKHLPHCRVCGSPQRGQQG
jgi:hypothetical protein